ncbi:MAG: bifunctional transaldolase/phosoglucose isomerase [Anaerolineales bacterium]|nr:bifunctional transaldolase/phosoglucose isomerase [Anaerolineales bacterium]
MTAIQSITQQGQSVWFNYLRRAFLESGELGNLIEAGISGITSTPGLFAHAITHSADYDEVLTRLLRQGKPIQEIYEALVTDDMQRAADCLKPVHEATDGLDGYVSVELNPALANDAVATVAAARHLLRVVDRGNVMVEVPATPAGIAALRQLTADGISVNLTHLFSLAVYKQAIAAYVAGLEEFFATHSVWRMAPSSVASLSLSRIDRIVDARLVRLGKARLQGKTAVSLAKIAYTHATLLFQGDRWHALSRHGARPLRLKWTRTTPRDFAYADTHYVEALIGSHTITTLSPATLNAFRDHGVAAPTLTQDLAAAREHLDTLERLGIDLEAIAARLQQESLADFRDQFQTLVRSVSAKRDQLQAGWQPLTADLGSHQPHAAAAIDRLCRAQTTCRLWAHDAALWPGAEAPDRLGWLHIAEAMQENVPRLHAFAQELREGGITDVVLLGAHTAVSPAHVLQALLGSGALPRLHLLSSTAPQTIHALTARLNPPQTLFVVSSKRGETAETLALFRYFYNVVLAAVGPRQAGRHFVAITDPATPLHTLADSYRFRRVFLDDPRLDEHQAPLSYVGLLPAALLGLDLPRLLDNALAMVCNASSCNCPDTGNNVGAQLGAMLAALAADGRDKLTLLASPTLAPFAAWAAQLVAATLGKQGRGLVPVHGEPPLPPDRYGPDRCFVHLRLPNEPAHDAHAAALRAAGFPVITLQWQTPFDVGGHFFVWQLATAVAAHLLDVNPFALPDLHAAGQRAQALLATFKQHGRLPPGKAAPVTAASISFFLNRVRPGDYVAIQAYLPQTAENERILQAFCSCIREQQPVPVTLAYGPDYLHTLGQLHKGGPRCGHFLQLTTPLPETDIAIPDVAGETAASLTFGVLQMALALADGQALAEQWRPMMRLHLPNGPADLQPLLHADDFPARAAA